MSHYEKRIAQNLLDKNPLSSSVFPRCHLRLAVNLRWTCQLSSLITDRPTCFSTNRPPSATERDLSVLPYSPPPLPSSCQNEKTSGRAGRFCGAASMVPSCVEGNIQACVIFLMVEWTQQGTVECDRMWQSYRGAWSDCEQLQGCESNVEKGCSHSCHPHTGDCQEMEICQIMFHDLVAHIELWIELWAHRDWCDVTAENFQGWENDKTDYDNDLISCASKVRYEHLVQILISASKLKRIQRHLLRVRHCKSSQRDKPTSKGFAPRSNVGSFILKNMSLLIKLSLQWIWFHTWVFTKQKNYQLGT